MTKPCLLAMLSPPLLLLLLDLLLQRRHRGVDALLVRWQGRDTPGPR